MENEILRKTNTVYVREPFFYLNTISFVYLRIKKDIDQSNQIPMSHPICSTELPAMEPDTKGVDQRSIPHDTYSRISSYIYLINEDHIVYQSNINEFDFTSFLTQFM